MAVATIKLHQTGKSLSAELKPKGVGVIEFRPHDNYDGEFGFDWVRMTNYGIRWEILEKFEKIAYKGNIGKYIMRQDEEEFDPRDEKYNKLLGMYKTFLHPIINDGLCYIPYLTILPKAEAKLNLFLNVIQPIEKYQIKYNDFFELNIKETDIPQNVGDDYKVELTIKCLKEFSENQYILFLGDDNLIGVIMVLANNQMKKIKVAYYDVSWKGNKNNDLISENDFMTTLKKYLAQFYIEPEIVSFGVYEDEKNENKILDFIDKKNLIKVDVDNPTENYIDMGNNRFNFINKILNKYTQKVKKCYKIFRLPYKIGELETIGKVTKVSYADGFASEVGGKSVFLAKDFNIEHTLAHEVLHCLGLEHTFDNSLESNTFVFRKYHTDNIMDYIEPDDSKRIFNKGITSSFWQWRKINNLINNKIKDITKWMI